MPSKPKAGERYWDLISPYWLPLNESWNRGVNAFLSESRKVPGPVIHLYAGHWCQSEVNNGGLCQFFVNTTGLLAPEALQALRTLGLLEWFAVLSEAISYFGDPYPRERAARLKMLPEGERGHKAADPFVALDDRFYTSRDAARDHWERTADEYAATA